MIIVRRFFHRPMVFLDRVGHQKIISIQAEGRAPWNHLSNRRVDVGSWKTAEFIVKLYRETKRRKCDHPSPGMIALPGKISTHNRPGHERRPQTRGNKRSSVVNRFPHCGDRKVVRFHCRSSEAHSICLAGTFNNWDPRLTPMSRTPGGEWVADVKLSPGNYEFLFVVDGHWCNEPVFHEPDCPYLDGVSNERDTMPRSNRFELHAADLKTYR